MIRIRKNPGIFVKDNSSYEFEKYKEFIEEVLLTNTINVSNISDKFLVKLIDNLELSKVVIERFKPLQPERYSVNLKLDFSDDAHGRFKNFTYSLMLFESISLFEKTYAYVPLINRDYYDTVIKETNIHRVIKDLYPLLIENFIKLCKNRIKTSNQELSEIKEILQEKFKRVIR